MTHLLRTLQFCQDLLERAVLMLIAQEGRNAHAVQEIAEGRIASQIRTQRQQIRELPNQIMRSMTNFDRLPVNRRSCRFDQCNAITGL